MILTKDVNIAILVIYLKFLLPHNGTFFRSVVRQEANIGGIEAFSHASFAVKVIVMRTLFCAIAMFARLGGWMPKSVIYMVLVAVPVIVLPTTFPCTSKTSLLVLPCIVRLPVI